MRFVDAFRRSDTWAALVTGGLILVVAALQGAGLYAFSAMEHLEEADLWVGKTLHSVAHELMETDATEVDSLRSSFNEFAPRVRLLRDERVVRSWGEWPDPSRIVEARLIDDGRTLTAFRLLRAQNWLVAGAPLRPGETVELALSLTHFAEEVAELGRGIFWMTIAYGLIAGLVGVGATVLAFQPLRRATGLLERTNAIESGVLLPARRTGDPVDRHVATLNGVLTQTRAAYQRMRRFSGEAAHELRTPLNRIRNVSEVALIHEDPVEIRAALEAVQNTTTELSEVVQALLFLAEIDSRQKSLRAEALDIDAWLERTAAAYQPMFEEKDVKFAVSSDAGTLECDRRLLDRLLVNLLENALHHTQSGDTVQVGAQWTEAAVAFWVDDSGPGVPISEREQVFEPFLRGRIRWAPGNGLGLALAKSIAEFHGGTIRLEDSPLGGARVIWWIPVPSSQSTA